MAMGFPFIVDTPAESFFRPNVTRWWESLVPIGLPHRKLLLDFTNLMAWFVTIVYGYMGEVPKPASCELRQTAVANMLLAFNELALWASSLTPAKGKLVVEADHLCPVGVLQRWVSKAGLAFFELPWENEYNCIGETNILYMRDHLLEEMSKLQNTWPWVVDYASICLMSNITAVVTTQYLYEGTNDAAVVFNLLDSLKLQNPTVVEVGVHKGGLSEAILEIMPELRLVGVDPYPGVYDGVPSLDKANRMGSEENYHIALALYRKFSDRARLIRLPSLVAAQRWNLGGIDLVYIDGEHDYDSCREDIANWAPLVSRGGIVAGDDYYSGVDGVVRAVNEQRPPDVTLSLAPHGVWWWRKP